MENAKLCIQCTDEVSGKTGDFLAEPDHGAHRAISPVLPNLVELYSWCRKNGWQSVWYSTEFPAGHYQR